MLSRILNAHPYVAPRKGAPPLPNPQWHSTDARGRPAAAAISLRSSTKTVSAQTPNCRQLQHAKAAAVPLRRAASPTPSPQLSSRPWPPSTCRAKDLDGASNHCLDLNNRRRHRSHHHSGRRFNRAPSAMRQTQNRQPRQRCSSHHHPRLVGRFFYAYSTPPHIRSVMLKTFGTVEKS